jgi:hypothetical protein
MGFKPIAIEDLSLQPFNLFQSFRQILAKQVMTCIRDQEIILDADAAKIPVGV